MLSPWTLALIEPWWKVIGAVLAPSILFGLAIAFFQAQHALRARRLRRRNIARGGYLR